MGDLKWRPTRIFTLHACFLFIFPSLSITLSVFFFHFTHKVVSIWFLIVYHVAMVQLLFLISVGSWWYFLPATRAEGGTGWVQLPMLAHPTCTHWPRPLSAAFRGSVKGELVELPSICSACLSNNSYCTSVCLRSKITVGCWLVVCWGKLFNENKSFDF